MSQDTDKWPIFDRSTSFKGKRGSIKESVGRTDSLPYVQEGNNSGMFTLRKNPDHKKRLPVLTSTGSQPAPPPPPQHSAPPPPQPMHAAPPTIPGAAPHPPPVPPEGFPPPPSMPPPLLQDRQLQANGGPLVPQRTASYHSEGQLRYPAS